MSRNARRPQNTTTDDPSTRFQDLAISDTTHNHPQIHHAKAASSYFHHPLSHAPQTPTPQSHSNYDPSSSNLSPHDLALQSELTTLRRLNSVLESTIHSLQHAQTSMSTTSQTIASASSLLTLWTRILSQTEHTSRLVLNPAWKGATQDQADAESEVVAREARQREEMRRREALESERRRAEEERQARMVMEAAGVERGGRGGSVRGRGVGRGVRASRRVSGGMTRGTTHAAETTTTRGGASMRRAAAVGYGRVGSVGTTRAGRTRGTAASGRGAG